MDVRNILVWFTGCSDEVANCAIEEWEYERENGANVCK